MGTKQLAQVVLVRDFARALADAKDPREILQQLEIVLLKGIAECSFAGYVRLDDGLQRSFGSGPDHLSDFVGTQSLAQQLTIACGPNGAFTLTRSGGFPADEQDFAESLAACAALSFQQEIMRVEIARIRRSDPLTGVANRRYFFELAERELSLTRRHQTPLSIILLDVDHFKRLNDEQGQEFGDEVLKSLASALYATLRTEDVLARYSGGEFVFLLPRISLPDATWGMGERLRRLVEVLQIESPNGRIHLTASLGVATIDSEHDDLNRLLKRADEGVSMAKTLGRNRCVALDLELMAPEP